MTIDVGAQVGVIGQMGLSGLVDAADRAGAGGSIGPGRQSGAGAWAGTDGRGGAGSGSGGEMAAIHGNGMADSASRLSARNGGAAQSSAADSESSWSSWQALMRSLGAVASESGGIPESATGCAPTGGTDAEEPQGQLSAKTAAWPNTPPGLDGGVAGSASKVPAGQPESAFLLATAVPRAQRGSVADAAGVQGSLEKAGGRAATGGTGSKTHETRSSADNAHKAKNEKPGTGSEKGTASAEAQTLWDNIQATAISNRSDVPATVVAVQARSVVKDSAQPSSSGDAAEPSPRPISELAGSPLTTIGTKTSAGIGASARMMESATPIAANRLRTGANTSDSTSGARNETAESGLALREQARGAEISGAEVVSPAGAIEEGNRKPLMARTGQPGESNGSRTVKGQGAAGIANRAAPQTEAASEPDASFTAGGAEKSGQGSSTPPVQPGISHTAHPNTNASGGAFTGHASGMTAANAASDMPAPVQDAASVRGTANAAAAENGGADPVAGSAHETFAALDAGATVEAPNWTHVGGQRAEAGFQDPALGWVGVRAALSGGGIHAAVVPASTEAAQALSGHIAGLSTYLSEHHSTVSTLTMAAPAGSGTDSGVEQSLQQNAGGHTDENRGAPAHTSPQTSGSVRDEGQKLDGAAQSGIFNAIASGGEGRGVHISVMA